MRRIVVWSFGVLFLAASAASIWSMGSTQTGTKQPAPATPPAQIITYGPLEEEFRMPNNVTLAKENSLYTTKSAWVPVLESCWGAYLGEGRWEHEIWTGYTTTVQVLVERRWNFPIFHSMVKKRYVNGVWTNRYTHTDSYDVYVTITADTVSQASDFARKHYVWQSTTITPGLVD
jgi:hypothetical protein